MALQLIHIDKIYDNGFQAVTDFNLDIKDHEFIVFVGPSGCGKSTTLRMIAGLEEITKGQLIIDGKLANEFLPDRRGIAMVFQSYALYPHLTVYENMAFGLELAGFDEDYIDENVKATAKILGLEVYLDRKPRALSGGQRQRVALGRAIIRHADIFLMDEPLSNLDAIQRVNMRSELIKIHRQVGATTIYVTHDQVEAMTMADRIVVMNLGVIQQVGTPEELYFHPKNMFVAGFIGDPPMNFVRGRITKGQFVSDDGNVTISDLPIDKERQTEGRKVVMGYRPESVSLEEKENSIKLSGKVELLEMLGDTLNVYLNDDGVKTIIKVNPDAPIKVEDVCTYYLTKDVLHFFDAKTEEVI